LGKITIAAKSDAKTSGPEFRQIRKAEPKWIYNLRKTGWENFHASPLPQRSNHLWRYTDPEIFLPANKPKQSFSKTLRLESNESELKNRGVIFGNLEIALANHEDLIKAHLNRAVSMEFGKFESLNMALWNGGRFLYIPDNTVIEEPIRLQYIPDSEFTACRTLVIIGENAEVSIIDDYVAGEKQESFLTNSVTELIAGKNSRLKYLFLNRLESDHKLFFTNRAVIESDVNFEAVYADFGGGLSKINTGTVLRGKGASSRMTGIIFSDGVKNTDYHTRHHHKSGDTYSDLDFRVVLKNKSKSAYTGLIRIEKDAANCEAYQENRNLLLNEGTRAESIPELEILTDQVQCSHGATMGPVDPEMIFYLKSRGLSESLAVRLIIEGFFKSALEKSPSAFKEILIGEMSDRLIAS
jgi:Fe-S cluster assembly protein SufD